MHYMWHHVVSGVMAGLEKRVRSRNSLISLLSPDFHSEELLRNINGLADLAMLRLTMINLTEHQNALVSFLSGGSGTRCEDNARLFQSAGFSLIRRTIRDTPRNPMLISFLCLWSQRAKSMISLEGDRDCPASPA